MVLTEAEWRQFLEFYSSVEAFLRFKETGNALRCFLHADKCPRKAREILLFSDSKRPEILPRPELTSEQRRLMERSVHAKFIGISADGSPILLLKIVRADLAELMKAFPLPQIEWLMVAFFEYFLLELSPKITETYSIRPFRLSAIIDLSGLKLASVMANPSTVKVMQAVSELLETRYPEIVHKIVIFNAGVFAWAAYKLFAPLFPKKIIARLTLAKGSLPDEVRASLDLRSLPAEYKGTFPGSLLQVPEQPWFLPNFFFIRTHPA